MSNRNFFYISMSRKETLLGWLYLILQVALLPYLVSAVLLILYPQYSPALLNLILFAVNFLAVGIIFRKFLIQSFRDMAGRVWGCVWKSALALIGCKLTVIVMNDFIFFYCPQYYFFTDTGPVLQNINDLYITQMAAQYALPMAIATVFLVPPVEELLHRGVVFGSLYTKSPLLACLISTLLFAATHVIGYVSIGDWLYLTILFLQYIPPALCLCWLYTGTDSILAPILMHMAFNAIGILSMR